MKYFLVLALLAFGLQGHSQTKVRDFVDSIPDSAKQSYFLYKSTLQYFNTKNSEKYNKFIKDINKVSIHLLDSTVTAKDIKNLRVKIAKDGFTETKKFKEFQGKASILVKNEEDKPKYIIILSDSKYNVIIELDGSPNMKFKMALLDLDKDKMKIFFKPTADALEKEMNKKEDEPINNKQ